MDKNEIYAKDLRRQEAIASRIEGLAAAERKRNRRIAGAAVAVCLAGVLAVALLMPHRTGMQPGQELIAQGPQQSATKEGITPYQSATKELLGQEQSATKKGVAPYQSATKEGIAPYQSATKEGIAPHQSATKEGIAPYQSATCSLPAPHQHPSKVLPTPYSGSIEAEGEMLAREDVKEAAGEEVAPSEMRAERAAEYYAAVLPVAVVIETDGLVVNEPKETRLPLLFDTEPIRNYIRDQIIPEAFNFAKL